MKIQTNTIENEHKNKKGKKGKKPKKSAKKGNKKTKRKKQTTKRKSRTITAPTSKHPTLESLGVVKHHNFMSITGPTMTKIFGLKPLGNRRYEVDDEPTVVSAILKLVMNVVETNDMLNDWSIALWRMNQIQDSLPDDVSITFTRVFERKDNDHAKREIKNRHRLSVLSSESAANKKRQSKALRHDAELLNAIDTGDSVVAFGAEAIVTAPDEVALEKAVNMVKDFYKTNDETRGTSYELDINKQLKPFLTFGPNKAVGNKDVYVDMTSEDAGLTATFVDSGGDRTPGAEYLGVSVGKLISSHAAYNFTQPRSLYVGNDTEDKTYFMSGQSDIPSQIHLSKIASRAYLLEGRSVAHFVIDHDYSVDGLLTMPIKDKRKVTVDVSKGLLNILEAIDNGELEKHPERILSRFPTHINNIIVLLSQFRDVDKVKTTDKFASVTRSTLIDFFVSKKYWSYDARHNLDDARLVGIRHNDFQQLSDFGQYVAQRVGDINNDKQTTEALNELDVIINQDILPTIPSLDTKTDPIIDELVKAPYKVIDLTGTSVGSMGTNDNPSTNVMLISYLNLIIPSMANGDLIVLHGLSAVSKIAKIVLEMIQSSGRNINIVFTESNQGAAERMMASCPDILFDFIAVDLYNNRIESLIRYFDNNQDFYIDSDWVEKMAEKKSSFFIKTASGLDYVYIDKTM